MNKNINAGLLLTVLFISRPAVAGEWSVGVFAGQSTFDDLNGICERSVPRGGPLNSSVAIQCDVDDKSSAAGINVSYSFNNTFGVEAGYVDLGDFDIGFREFPSGEPFAFLPDIKVDLASAYLAGTASYNFTESWSVTGRLGYYDSEAKLSGTFNDLTVEGDGDVYTGASLDYEFIEGWSAQLRYDSFDIDVYSFGLKYSFGK